MTSKSNLELRIELAEGHWELGEYDDALLCIERAVHAEADLGTVFAVVGKLLEAAGENDLPQPIVEKLGQLHDRLAPELEDDSAMIVDAVEEIPVATSTMAELLEQQGHRGRALQVAAEVLRRNANDDRALAVQARLETESERAPTHEVAETATQQIVALEAFLDRVKRHNRGGLYA